MNKKYLLILSILAFIIGCSADDPKKAPDIQAQTVSYQEALDAIKKTKITVGGATFDFRTVTSIEGGVAKADSSEATISGGGTDVYTLQFEGMLGDAITKNSGGKIDAAVGEKKAQQTAMNTTKTFTVVLSPGSAEGIAYEFDEQLTKALSPDSSFTIRVTATKWTDPTTAKN